MLSHLYKFKRLIAFVLVTVFCVSNTSMAVFAAEITKYTQLPTNTNIEQVAGKNIWNITTTTTAKSGTIGFNNFAKFNVSKGDIVNLRLINQQNKLVNLIFDNSASQINGIVNSFKGNSIGGNVLFANPHGFVIGKDGVFNVGSLTLMTPKEDVMKKIFDGSSVNETNLDKLITFKFGSDNYYVGTSDDGKTKLEMVPAEITIDGKINSGAGIDIINGGRTISIGKDAELNANMTFTTDENGENVTASVGPAPTDISTFKTAMDEGKGINIISQNRSSESAYMSSIVNIEGKVHANGADVITQTEIHGMSYTDPTSGEEKASVSLVNAKDGADIKGRNVTLRALSEATHGDHNLVGAESSGFLQYLAIPVNCLIDNFVHLGKMNTKVTIEDGAKINASSSANIFAKTDMSAFSAMTISPIFALDLVLLDVLTETRVKSGASIDSKSLNVNSITNANVSVSTTSTSILDILSDNVFHKGTFGEWGSYAITIVNADINNRAIIENGANLTVAEDLNVLANMTRDFTIATKNGFPLVDKNKGPMGLAVGIAIIDSENEAIMNTDADISGSLVVNANYTGKLTQSTSGNSGSPGQDGAFGMGGKIVKNIIKGVTGGFFCKSWGSKIDQGFDHVGGNSADRANATFGKIHIAGAVNVANDDVKNHAYIGHAKNTEAPNDVDIKPTISAKNITVASVLEDHKSHVTATAASSNGITAVAGAVAVNSKDLDSDAKAYGNFTVKGSNGNSQFGLIVRSNTKVVRPSMLDDLWNFLDFLGIKHYEKTEKKKVDEVKSTNVDDYLANFNVSSDMQEKIDQNTSVFSLLKIFNYLTQELGAEGFFQTYAESSASAAAREGKTSGWAGAFGVTIADTKSNAELVGGSNVTLNGANANENKVIIAANTDSTMWVGTSLMSIFNIAKIKEGSFAPGTSARDGNATGGSISVLVNSADTTASVGNGAVITKATSDNAGDVDVKATENGQFINLAAGSSAADEAGISGNIAVSVVPSCETKATIEQGAVVNNAKDVTVEATKDDNWYDVIFSFANSKASVAFGASTLFIFDNVTAYIMGNVTASGDVLVNALYDKAFLNVGINMGLAKSGQQPAEEPNIDDIAPAEQPNQDEALLPGLFEEFMEEQGANLNNLGQVGDAQNIINQVNNVGNGNIGNPDKNTYSYAGTILLSVLKDSVQAYIGNGAKVTAGKGVKVSAKSIDQNIEVGTILSFNGNSGGGGTVGFNLNMNDVDAYIGSATVDAKDTTEVIAGEDNILYSFSAGIGQAKDSSGVGTLSLDIQKNDINASIREGAKINTSDGYDVENQSVNVKADFDNHLVKGVGAISIKAGGTQEGSAKGAAIDVDAAKTDVHAYIKGAEINASKAIDVAAKSNTKLIDITAAGAVSTNGGAYDGSVGLYVSTGTTEAYIENTQVNKSEYNVNNVQTERTNKGADMKVSAENIYDDLTVTGAIAGGTQNSVGGSVRVDVIKDTINSYVSTNSVINTTGKLDLVNKSSLDSIAVTAAGSLSTSANAFVGAIMLIVDDTTQNSYIEGSTVNAGSVNFDTDAILKTIAVTGGVSVATTGHAIGGSLYVAVAANEMNTYILNSDVTATNNISLATDFNTDILSVVISGSGGTGVAGSGAINTVVNNSHSNTYIKSENNNEVKSTEGKVSVKGTDDLKFKAAVGNVNISIGSVAAGAAIDTVVDNSNLNAGIEGTKVTAKTGVDVGAKATNDIMTIAVGGSGGLGIAAEGSINTVVMAADTKAYIKNSDVNVSDGDVSVTASDEATIKGGTGAVSASISAGALAASIVTGVINNMIEAQIENSRVVASNDVTVSATAKESIGTETVPFITIAGGGAAGVSIDGVVDTMVINSTADAHIKGKKSITEENVTKDYGVKSGNNVTVASTGEVTLRSVGGAAGGGGVGGVGATVHTVVIDKDTVSESENTIVEGANITSTATETDNFFTTLVSAAGGGTAGVAGAVNTNVITSDVKTGFKNSTLKATNDITITSNATANMQTITGGVAGGGVAGVGLSAVNDIIRYRMAAYADNVTADFDKIDIDAKTDNTYKFSTVSGAGGGTAGVAGVENVNYINNEVKAYATGNLTGNTAEIDAEDKVTFKNSYSGVVGGGGIAGVGATVEVNSITSTVLAYVGGNNVKVNNIAVNANGKQTFDHIVVAGFAAGGVGAGAGTALANLVETTVKAYVTENSNIYLGEDDYTNKVSLNATNTMNLTEDIGAIAFGAGGGVGATVAVNKIKNVVEAYTGQNTKISSKDVTLNAQSNNNLGNSDTGGSLLAVAGAGGLYAGVAGTVMYNGVEDIVNAYIGKTNTIKLANNGKLDVKATDITKIYDGTGAVAGGAGGVGASVDYNTIKNTVVAYIKSDSTVTGSANVSVIADSQETVDNDAYVVGFGAGALSGAVLYLTIGKNVGNASYNNFSDNKDKENFKAGETQSQQVLNQGTEKTTGANSKFNDSYNKNIDKVAQNGNTQNSRARTIAKKQSTDSLYTKSEHSGTTLDDTDRVGTTSAFVDTNVAINANNLTVNAKNTNNVTLETLGVAIGAVGIGVSIAVSDNDTTTNAFIQNNANINVNNLTLKAESSDTQRIKTIAAAGGIVGGSGSSSHINSNKTTNTYINKQTNIQTVKDMLITAVSKSDLRTNAVAGAGGGVAVGVSVAHITDGGSTRIDIGEDVSLTSQEGNIVIKTDADEYAFSEANAATGNLVGGTGADSAATVGKDTTVNIGKNFSAVVNDREEDIKDDDNNVIGTKYIKQGKIEITSNAKNNSLAESNGRAYGGISAGGTNTKAKVTNTSGVKISDADSAKTIKANEVKISSKANNYAQAKTYAGAGCVAGISGSGVYTDITSTNDVYIGKNYDVKTGKYDIVADTMNQYLAYNKSDAFGVITAAIPLIRNNVNSTVKTDSEADIESDSTITVRAVNEVKKEASSNYDLYGGAGGLANGAGGSIIDNVTMTTNTYIGGNYAKANGVFGNGSIDVSALNIANINEKASLYSKGGIQGADTDSKVNLSGSASVTVSNKGIITRDDNINYAARNDVDIYTKCNVESYGGVAGAGGNSSAIVSHVNSDVTFMNTARSTSQRDTNISAVSNKNVQAYMYARTRGAVSLLNDQANAKSDNSVATVHINGNGQDNEETGNAVITAYDSINITAMNTASTIRAQRDSKAYQLWFIPYTGSGREYTNNARSSEIVVNGILKSGKGFNKSLTINIDGSGETVITGDGIHAEKTKVGSISTADIDYDISLFEQSKQSATEKYNDYVTQENAAITGYNQTINDNTTAISNYETNNNELQGKIDTDTATKTQKQGELDIIKEPYTDLGGLTTDESIDKFCTDYAGNTDPAVQAVVTAANTYLNDKTPENEQSFSHTILALTAKYAGLSDDINTLNTKIANYNSQIETNNNNIIVCQLAITTATSAKTAAETALGKAQELYNEQITEINSAIAALEQQKAEAGGGEIAVYSIVVDDVIVRNGEIVFNGDGTTPVIGNGYIKTPGNNASITVLNNSVSNLVFNKLSINGDLKGGIRYNGSILSVPTPHIVKAPDNTSTISIRNMVDKNDPTINIDADSNAGDIVLRGAVENPYGLVEITNYTGNVLSEEGGITARDLHIRVPNGGFEQQYTTNNQIIGGSDGNGAIVAAGDIIISAKTIDINGLIKSGTEIKEVEIPDNFKIKKVGNDYVQVVTTSEGVTETVMTESSTTKGYYYLILTDDSSDLAVMRQIRAYFKPSDPNQTGNDIAGDIYLFKADTSGGNITLTGNIVNSSNNGNGRIELLNGYGHINVVNHSEYDLVTSALTADTNNKGVLTINDFKMSSQTDTTFDNLKQSDLTNEYLADHAGKYTVSVNNSGEISPEATGQTTGNGYWDNTSIAVSTTADGATVHSINYVPGDDAWVKVRDANSGFNIVYVKRSWWTEFWCGKKYVLVWYYNAPVYEVKNNPVSVNFVGFDKPEINITSKGNVVMNSNISAMSGDVTIRTTEGSITTNSVNYAISAKNITLEAGELGNRRDIGENVAGVAVRPIQTVIYDDGLLTAVGHDIYINYPKTDVSNINLNAVNYAYLATDAGVMDMKDKTIFGLQAVNLELRADTINLNPSDMAQNGDSLINVRELSARAKNDIYIRNKSLLTVKYIVSENKGNITLESFSGPIYAGETDAFSDYNIHGGNLTIRSMGDVGTAEKPLKVANECIYDVIANNDIYIDSYSRIHADNISSLEGSVNLTAKFGIIASEITTDIYGQKVGYNDQGKLVYEGGSEVAPENIRYYNISSGSQTVGDNVVNGNITLTTEAGNIENVVIDTNGIISASAGFSPSGSISDGTSDINITLTSKLPTQKQLDDLESGDLTYEDFLADYKDMTIKSVRGTHNVTLSSEKGVKAADVDSYIFGDSITINAIGDVGAPEQNYAIKLIPNREVSIYTKAGSSVYIDNTDSLKVTHIDVTAYNPNAQSSQNKPTSLENVVINSQDSVVNAAKTQTTVEGKIYYDQSGNPVDTEVDGGATVDVNKFENETQTAPNIRAKNIKITTGNSIGDYNTELLVQTTSNDYAHNGLTFNASQKVFIKGAGDTLNILSGTTNDDVNIMHSDTNIRLNDITTKGNVSVTSQANVYAKNIVADSDDHNQKIQIFGNDVVLDGAQAKQVTLFADKATLSGDVTSDVVDLVSGGETLIDGATVNKLTSTSEEIIMSVYSAGDTTVKDSTITGNTNFVAQNVNVEINPNLYIQNSTFNGNVINEVDGNTEITTMTVNGNLSNKSDGMKVTEKLTVSDITYINAANDIIINEINSNTLTTESKNADITKLVATDNVSITTTKNTTIKDGTVGGKFTNKSGKTVVDEVTGETTVVAGDTKVTGTLTVTGDADIDSTNDVIVTTTGKIIAKNIYVDSKNANIANFESQTDTIITTSGDTEIGNGTVGGEFNNTSENTVVTGKLDVVKDANITAENNVVIADGHMEQDLNVVAQNLNIEDMQLDGVINAEVNTADINTSYDLNVGVIQGNGDNIDTEDLRIKSAQSILNSMTENDVNIYAKNIDLTAGNSVGESDLPLVMSLPKGNSVAIEAGNLANVKTMGAGPNYTKYKAKEAIIKAEGKLKIKGLEVEKIDARTTSKDVDISGVVKKRGQIRTEDKRVSINNVNFEPDHSATAQLHTGKNKFRLRLNASNDVKINSKYVVRHNQGIVINGTDFLSSAESEAIKAAELSLKNSDRRKKTIDYADETLKRIQTLSDDEVLIRTIHGDIITPDNVYDVINSGDSISVNIIKTKEKAKATIYDKISYVK